MATLSVRRLFASERGAEVIEMALVTPLLLLLVMGIVDFGFLFQRYVVLTNAAVEGARVATLPGYTTLDGEARARDYAATGGVPGAVGAAGTPVTLPGPGGGPAVQMTVTHVYTLQYVRPIMTLFGGSAAANITLQARSTMRNQLGGS